MNVLLCECFDGGNGQYERYKQMLDLCVDSFDRNLQGDWVWQIMLPSDVQAPQEMFRRVFREEMALVRAGHNVFRIGIDMLCLKPCSVFGRFDKFMMFSESGTNIHSKLAEGSKDVLVYLCGAYYWPSTTPAELLAYAEKLYGGWHDWIWDYCQWLYNKVFWKQGPQMERLLDPRYSFQNPTSGQIGNRGVDLQSAYIAHYHATRGQLDVVQRMQKDWSQYGTS